MYNIFYCVETGKSAFYQTYTIYSLKLLCSLSESLSNDNWQILNESMLNFI